MEKEKLVIKAEYDVETKTAVASSGALDRHGEIVEQAGWELKNFKKNPVLLWAHDHTIPAIGKAENIRIDGEGKKARLLFEPVFHEITDFGKAIKKMFDEKILNSFSVGYKPIDVEDNKYITQELLEISAGNAPANADARMLAYKSFDTGILKSLGWDVEEKEKFEKLEKEFAEVKELAEQAVKGLIHLNPLKGRKDALTNRQMLLKVIARANDKMLEKKELPVDKRVSVNKVIKRAVERLLQDNKEVIKNGQN